ncbi:MAG: hypothetical protein KC561_21005, partial [Myxococcales bacterium]|nr:hypothetical protein [Myxococcales bacterium]
EIILLPDYDDEPGSDIEFDKEFVFGIYIVDDYPGEETHFDGWMTTGALESSNVVRSTIVPTRLLSQSCDSEVRENVCDFGLFCDGESDTCVEGTAPVLDIVNLQRPSLPNIGADFFGTDAEGDVVGFTANLLEEDDGFFYVFFPEIHHPVIRRTAPSSGDGMVWGATSFQAEDTEGGIYGTVGFGTTPSDDTLYTIDWAEFQLVDSSGLRSEPYFLPALSLIDESCLGDDFAVACDTDLLCQDPGDESEWYCAYALGADCDVELGECAGDYICDEEEAICVIPFGEACGEGEPCPTGGVCDSQTSLCAVLGGEACVENVACESGTE